FGKIVAHETPQQTHKLADFARRPRPVFRTERENRENLDADLAGGANGAPQRLNAAAMPFRAWKSARRRPTAISVHDNSNMPRHIECRRHITLNIGLGHNARPQTVRISFSFAESIWSISAIPASVAFWTSPEKRSWSSLLILWSFSSFLMTSMASRRTWRTATRAVSAYLCATFTSSLRRSSLSSGIRSRMVCPSVAGDRPRFEFTIAFSTG